MRLSPAQFKLLDRISDGEVLECHMRHSTGKFLEYAHFDVKFDKATSSARAAFDKGLISVGPKIKHGWHYHMPVDICHASLTPAGLEALEEYKRGGSGAP